MEISITKFASDSNLLGMSLYPKQAEILESFWNGNYQIGVWALGRRAGKSFLASAIACYAACMLADEYKKCMRRGERFHIISVANTQTQSKIALQGVKDLILNSPILKRLVVADTANSLELSNGAVFKAIPASSRGGRGDAAPLIIFDEIAFAHQTEGNASDATLFQALAPSVAQFGKLGKILLLSSPHTKTGLFYELFKQGFDDDYPYIQSIQLPTWEVNPSIDPEFLAQQKARDPVTFEIEYGANFSQPYDSFLQAVQVEQCINSDRTLLESQKKYQGYYYLALDPAKGNRDAYTACIAHYEEERLVVDLWHEFTPEDGSRTIKIEDVENWILAQHDHYEFTSVVLDQYNSLSTIQRLNEYLPIRELTWTATSKTKAYSKLRELISNQQIEFYPHPKAIAQLKNLSIKYTAGGNWSVSGGVGVAVDDYASALAGVVLEATPDDAFDYLEAFAGNDARGNLSDILSLISG